MKKIEIQTILVETGNTMIEEYYMRNLDGLVSKISQDKWFELYDKDVIVLPPITKTKK